MRQRGANVFFMPLKVLPASASEERGRGAARAFVAS